MLHALTPVRTSAPAATPVSVAEAKTHLSVEHSDDDTYISALIDTAVAALDGHAGILGRCLVTQSWRADYAGFPIGEILRLPLRPAASITTITYYDEENAQQTLAVETYPYRLLSDALGPMVYLSDDYDWPDTYERPDAVSVTAVYGYGSASSVPAAIRHAILLHVGHLYGEREGTIDDSMAYRSLIGPYRVMGLS